MLYPTEFSTTPFFFNVISSKAVQLWGRLECLSLLMLVTHVHTHVQRRGTLLRLAPLIKPKDACWHAHLSISWRFIKQNATATRVHWQFHQVFPLRYNWNLWPESKYITWGGTSTHQRDKMCYCTSCSLTVWFVSSLLMAYDDGSLPRQLCSQLSSH